MKRNKLLLLILLPVLLANVSSCDKEETNTSNLNEIVFHEDTSIEIRTEYDYKIIKSGSTVKLPKVTVNRANVKSVTYIFDGAQITNSDEFVAPSVCGIYQLDIYVMDDLFKTNTSIVKYRVVENDLALNTIYDLSTKEGLESHLGTERIGLNNHKVVLYHNGERTYVNSFGDTVTEKPSDSNGNFFLPFEDDVTNELVSDYIICENQQLNTRMTFNNALYKNWDKKFETMYFYFYNGTGAAATINFNSYSFTVNEAGWKKIIIAPKTVGEKVVTDYTLISALGNSTTLVGMIDLSDCIGTFLKIDFERFFGRYAISSIYGIPVEE